MPVVLCVIQDGLRRVAEDVAVKRFGCDGEMCMCGVLLLLAMP